MFEKYSKKERSPCSEKPYEGAILSRIMPVLVLITYVILSAHVTFCSSWKQSLEHMKQCNI